MRPVLENGKLDAVLSTVLANVRVMPAEMMPLKWCIWRYLGADLVSGENIPSFPMAQIPGYAVNSSELAGAAPETPVILEVIERIVAGQQHHKKLEPGQTSFVEAGAQVPSGADSVVPMRLVSEAEERAKFVASVNQGFGMEHEGAIAKAKAKVLSRGDFINPARVGMLAALGKNEVAVVRAPTIGVVVAGRELVPFDSQKLKPGQLRDAYGRMVAARLSELHLPHMLTGEVLAGREQLANIAARAINQVDMLLICGNLAADPQFFESDLIKSRIEHIAAGLDVCPPVGFHFALLDGKPLFSLSGPPERVLLGLDCIVFPAIQKAMGARRFYERDRTGKLDRPLSASSESEILIRATLELNDTGLASLRPAHGNENANLSQIMRANSIIRLQPGEHELEAGAEVKYFSTSARSAQD
ncbi:MAG: hypothetical protein HRF49_05030 [bacterium]|jgi:molybdopterin molybdotransferase